MNTQPKSITHIRDRGELVTVVDNRYWVYHDGFCFDTHRFDTQYGDEIPQYVYQIRDAIRTDKKNRRRKK